MSAAMATADGSSPGTATSFLRQRMQPAMTGLDRRLGIDAGTDLRCRPRDPPAAVRVLRGAGDRNRRRRQHGPLRGTLRHRRADRQRERAPARRDHRRRHFHGRDPPHAPVPDPAVSRGTHQALASSAPSSVSRSAARSSPPSAPRSEEQQVDEATATGTVDSAPGMSHGYRRHEVVLPAMRHFELPATLNV
jgi:hypothetical protein